LANPKIEDLRVPALGDEDIRRLNVTVNNAFRVRGVECVGNLDGQRQECLILQRTAGDHVLQCHPIQKFHRDEGLAILFINLVDGADIRVVESRCRLRFTLETGQSLGVLGYLVRQELQRYKAVQLHILGLIDHTHPAAAQLLHDAVVRDGLADQEWTCSGLPC
jgi:hypothetical protein